MNLSSASIPLPASSAGTRTLAAAVVWLAVVGGAMALLVSYSNTAGPAPAAPATWPAASRIAFDAQRPTLVLLAHPHCPCTRATLGELEVLMVQNEGRVSARVVFVQPKEFGADWVKAIYGARLRRFPA